MKIPYLPIVLYALSAIQVFAGTSIQINHADVDMNTETLTLYGINFDSFGTLQVSIGDVVLTDACNITSAQVQCSLSGTPVLAGGTWVVKVSAGNSPAQNDDIDISIQVAAGIPCGVTGDYVSCYSGAPETLGVGQCQSGVRICQADGSWGSCQGEITPVEEFCSDEVDNNCDGFINEYCLCTAQADCDDAVSCTVDSCDPILGCTHVPNDTVCDDGISCTIDICDAQGCTNLISAQTCLIDGQCYNDGALSPGGCGECNSALSNTQWTPLSSASLCRLGAGVCDVNEFCNGFSINCPPDVYAQDGTACEVGGATGVCSSGVCLPQ